MATEVRFKHPEARARAKNAKPSRPRPGSTAPRHRSRSIWARIPRTVVAVLFYGMHIAVGIAALYGIVVGGLMLIIACVFVMLISPLPLAIMAASSSTWWRK